MASPTHRPDTVDIDAGDLRHVLAVQVKTEAAVGTRGQPSFIWGPDSQATIRASLMPLTGRKFEIARQLVPSATHEVATRWFSGMSVKKRLKFGTRIFNVGHMLNVMEMNTKLLLTVTEDQATESV